MSSDSDRVAAQRRILITEPSTSASALDPAFDRLLGILNAPQRTDDRLYELLKVFVAKITEDPTRLPVALTLEQYHEFINEFLEEIELIEKRLKKIETLREMIREKIELAEKKIKEINEMQRNVYAMYKKFTNIKENILKAENRNVALLEEWTANLIAWKDEKRKLEEEETERMERRGLVRGVVVNLVNFRDDLTGKNNAEQVDGEEAEENKENEEEGGFDQQAIENAVDKIVNNL